jgi:hypothetical protein
VLPPGLKLSPEQFALVCEANHEAVLELTATGQVIAMTSTGGETTRRNTRLLFRLQAWAERRGGWEVFDSSGGFRLSDGSVLSPDAAVLRLECWKGANCCRGCGWSWRRSGRARTSVSTCLERGGPLASSGVSRFRGLPPTAIRPWPKRCWISSQADLHAWLAWQR